MVRRFQTGKKLVVGAVVLGVMTLGSAGVAAADATAASGQQAPHHVNCTRASKALARIQATESRIAAGLPALHTAAGKAQQKGNAKRADRIKKRINRMESPAFKARLEKRKAKIQAACQVSAPAASATGGSSATA